MNDYMTLKYAPALTAPGGIHVWRVYDGGTEHLSSVDEVCHDGHCVTADDFDEERTVSVRDTEVTRKGGTTTLTLIDVASEPDE